jgi:hypothetical protein
MRVAVLHVRSYAEYFAKGVLAVGDQVSMHKAYVLGPGQPFDTVGLETALPADVDVLVTFGVGSLIYTKQQGLTTPTVYVDAGYTRDKKHFRICMNSRQPTHYIADLRCPDDRRERFGWECKPWKLEGDCILTAWSRPGYNKYAQLRPLEEYAAEVAQEIGKYSLVPVVNRPKPQGAQYDIPGIERSTRSLQEDLERARVLVTYGSSICVPALMAGVPAVILGDAVTRPISSTSLMHVGHPRLASMEERVQLLNNLAYHQWSIDELCSGTAWEYIRDNLLGCGQDAGFGQHSPVE